MTLEFAPAGSGSQDAAAPAQVGAAEGGLRSAINRTRFRLLLACSYVSMAGVFILLAIIPPLFSISLVQALGALPLVIAVGALTGTAQVLYNEYGMRRIVWLAHPEGIRVPELESLAMVIVRISLAVSALSIPLGALTLYTFRVTAFDLIRLGLEDLPDILVAYTIAVAIVAAGYFAYRKFRRTALVSQPPATGGEHLRELVDAVHSFPLRSAIVSLLLWGISGILLGWGARFLVQFDSTLSVWTLLAIVTLGVVAFPIQYFAFKRIFTPLGESLLANATEAYRVESLGEAARSIEDERVQRERLFTLARLGLAGALWGVLAISRIGIEVFYLYLLLAYTAVLLVSFAGTYSITFRQLAANARLLGDGFALTLFVQYSGSMTTLVIGFYFLMTYSLTLHHGFEKGMIFASLYSVLYGGILLCEYFGLLHYAPAVIDGEELLRILIERAPWRAFHPSAVFLASFITIAGGMFGATFLARMFLKRQSSVSGLLDLD